MYYENNYRDNNDHKRRLYVGIWICFIGGIVDIIEQIRAPELESLVIAIGIAKVFFAGIIGWLSGALLVLPGLMLLDD